MGGGPKNGKRGGSLERYLTAGNRRGNEKDPLSILEVHPLGPAGSSPKVFMHQVFHLESRGGNQTCGVPLKWGKKEE